MRIAYVIGRHPALSHAFLLREIAQLRDQGVSIETISIRPAREQELRSEADRAESRSTFYVLPTGPVRLARAHLAALASGPRRYLGTLAHALRLGPARPRAWLWQLFYFAEAMVVWRRCRELGVSHMHSHFADTGTDSAMLAAHFERRSAGGAGWSWSFTLHGPTEFAESANNRLAAKLRSARFVVCISDFARRSAVAALERAGGGRANLRVIPLGVDVERFSPAPAPAEAGDRGPVVLCLGRLVPQKGQRFLLEAAARLAAEGTDARFEIAGEGPERAALERRAAALGVAERVAFLGGVGQDEIVGLYRRAAVFCLPSLDEGLPVVLMEAMACAVPVLTTRIAAVPELVADGESGVLVEPRDADALAAALRELLADPGLRDRLGEAGRREISRRHRLDRRVAELASLIRLELGPAGRTARRER